MLKQIKVENVDSAKFRDVKFVNETVVACGEINLKNHRGEYIGYKEFVIGFVDKTQVFYRTPDAYSYEGWRKLCEGTYAIQKLNWQGLIFNKKP